MSLDLNPDALITARNALRQRDGRNTASQTGEDHSGFADLMRVHQMNVDNTRTDKADRSEPLKSAADNSEPAQKTPYVDRSDPSSAKTLSAEKSDSVEQTQADTEGQPVSSSSEAKSSETDQADEATIRTATDLQPDQACITDQTLKASLTIAKADTPTPEFIDAVSDVPVATVVQALTDLKSALKAELSDQSASITTTQGEPDKTPEPTLTDAQLTELMQALLSGKPLTPELKALSETPKVAEALKSVRDAMALLDQPLQAKTPDSTLAMAAKADGPAAKVTGDQKVAEPELDLKFGNLLDGEPAASEAPVAQTVSLAAKASLADSSAALARSKPSESPVTDFKPAPVQNETPLQALNQADTRAAETLQLKRSEAALGSSLSTTALNNITQMSAHIARHMTAKSTQFNMELYPADMGRVDVKLSVNHDGTLSAALRFDSPVAESQFRAQADDLRRQLEAQGFQLAEGSLSFSSRQNSDQANQGQSSGNNASAFADDAPDAGRAAQAFGAFDQMPDAPAPGALLAQKLGLNLLGAQTYRLSLNVTA